MIFSSPQEAEIAVVMLYELGEGAPEEALKPDSGTLGQLAVALMQVRLFIGFFHLCPTTPL